MQHVVAAAQPVCICINQYSSFFFPLQLSVSCVCLLKKNSSDISAVKKTEREEEKRATMREGGKYSIMAACVSVKLEAYGD